MWLIWRRFQKYSINSEYKWYAIYTRLFHEKAVESSLINNNIEVFLPKRKILHKWSDRKKWIEEPLFRPYLFVRVSNKEYYKVLQTTSVLNYICFEGKAAPIPDNQIEFIKRVVDEKFYHWHSKPKLQACSKSGSNKWPFIKL